MLNTKQKLTEREAYDKLNKNPDLKHLNLTEPESGKKIYDYQAKKALAVGVFSKFPFKRDRLEVLRKKWGFTDKKAREIVDSSQGVQKSETQVKSEINRVIKNLGEISETKLKKIEEGIRKGEGWSDIRRFLKKRLKRERKRNIIASRYSDERLSARKHGKEAIKEALTRKVGEGRVKIDHTRIAKGQSYGIAALGDKRAFSQDDFSSVTRSSIGSGKLVKGLTPDTKSLTDSGKGAQGITSGIGAKKINTSSPMSGNTPKGTRPIGL